ncbi:MAG: septal ring lytic transglycosylase RlpA family protein [Gemmatimonadota bacterium]|nr:septal ring lytic transglycosylase RlpA family protein [Gemmatimonadota bacterium]
MRVLLTVLVLAAAAGCAANPAPLSSVPSGWSEEGEASWYGPGFHGRRTASGEVYDMEAMTAAHRRLPFGTRVEVRNLDNGRRTVVRINDRGPFAGGRILDLSRAAARELGVIGPGVSRVRLTLAERSPLESCSRVQIGAFADESNARGLAGRARRAGEPATVERGADGLHRVVLGPYDDPVRAERIRARYGGIVRPCP